jgi:hypothetical protein
MERDALLDIVGLLLLIVLATALIAFNCEG